MVHRELLYGLSWHVPHVLITFCFLVPIFPLVKPYSSKTVWIGARQYWAPVEVSLVGRGQAKSCEYRSA